VQNVTPAAHGEKLASPQPVVPDSVLELPSEAGSLSQDLETPRYTDEVTAKLSGLHTGGHLTVNYASQSSTSARGSQAGKAEERTATNNHEESGPSASVIRSFIIVIVASKFLSGCSLGSLLK
jgi:hypothetical protein